MSKNRIANAKNPFQGEAKKVLCVCSAGILRSPTAANVLHREFGFNTRAVGIVKEYALIAIDDALIEWADEIVVMESWMAQELSQFDGGLICLGIDDNYDYMDKDLQEIIKNSYSRITGIEIPVNNP